MSTQKRKCKIYTLDRISLDIKYVHLWLTFVKEKASEIKKRHPNVEFNEIPDEQLRIWEDTGAAEIFATITGKNIKPITLRMEVKKGEYEINF